jgi:inorganic pyrophosphatase
VWLEHKCQAISFWHDVPLYPNASNPAIINAVVEIPRWEDGKIEIRRPEPLNPIFRKSRKHDARGFRTDMFR